LFGHGLYGERGSGPCGDDKLTNDDTGMQRRDIQLYAYGHNTIHTGGAKHDVCMVGTISDPGHRRRSSGRRIHHYCCQRQPDQQYDIERGGDGDLQCDANLDE
jgi:hypothetical protein